MPQGGVEERRHVEGVCVRSVYGGVHAGAVEVQGKDRKEHDHEPNLCENEEFQRRVSAVSGPPEASQGEKRGEGEMPQDSEKQEGGGRGGTDEGQIEGKGEGGENTP